MSKFKLTVGSDNYYMDSTSFAGTGTSDIAMLSPGSLSVVGVDSITGSTGADSIKLIGLTASQALSTFGVNTALFAVTALTFDTNNTLAATIDTLLGNVIAEEITLKNTGTVKSVNLKYVSGSPTVSDTLTIATLATLVSDTITLIGASKITLSSDSTTGATDNIIGSSGADNITLNDGQAETSPVTAFWNYKSMGGIDTITGDAGADSITLTAASSIKYTTGGGTDTITGSSGNDSVTLSSTALNYATGSSAGAGGTDTIVGTTGADTLTLGTNSVPVVNLKYNSNGTTVADSLTFGTGADSITLISPSKVSITAGGIIGGDSYFGSTGADTISLATASVGNTIQGNGGADILTASTTAAGVDTFKYISKTDSGATSTTRDVILNFDAGASTGTTTVDILNFTALLPTGKSWSATAGVSLLSGDRTVDTSSTAVAEWGGAGNPQARFYDTGSFAYTDASGASQTSTGGLLEIDIDGNELVDMSILLVGVHISGTTNFLDAGDLKWA